MGQRPLNFYNIPLMENSCTVFVVLYRYITDLLPDLPLSSKLLLCLTTNSGEARERLVNCDPRFQAEQNSSLLKHTHNKWSYPETNRFIGGSEGKAGRRSGCLWRWRRRGEQTAAQRVLPRVQLDQPRAGQQGHPHECETLATCAYTYTPRQGKLHLVSRHVWLARWWGSFDVSTPIEQCCIE